MEFLTLEEIDPEISQHELPDQYVPTQKQFESFLRRCTRFPLDDLNCVFFTESKGFLDSDIIKPKKKRRTRLRVGSQKQLDLKNAAYIFIKRTLPSFRVCVNTCGDKRCINPYHFQTSIKRRLSNKQNASTPT